MALTIHLYLIREIGKTLAVVLGVLVALFASYGASGFLSDAVNGLLPADTIAELIGLKALISLEVLIPVSLYISTVLSFGRLYSDSEFTAMFALHVTPAKVMGAVLTLSGCLALLVAGLSLSLRPWAYQRLHELSKRAETLLNVDYLEAGTFYVSEHGNRTVFIGQRDEPKAPARDVFIQLTRDNRTQIIYARQAHQKPHTSSDDRAEIYLSDAHVYEFDRGKGPDDNAVSASEIILPTGKRNIDPPGYSSVAASSASLAASDSAEDVAEFQWRLSTPLSTLLLGMLGVPLSRARPRQGKYTKIGTAVLIYSSYYLLCTSARTWVQNGVVAKFPGIWWVPALLALVLIIALSAPVLEFNFRRRRA